MLHWLTQMAFVQHLIVTLDFKKLTDLSRSGDRLLSGNSLFRNRARMIAGVITVDRGSGGGVLGLAFTPPRRDGPPAILAEHVGRIGDGTKRATAIPLTSLMRRLGNPITFNEYQQSIALATARSPEETYAVVTGWGSKSGPPSNLSNVQQYLNARIIKFSDCHNIYDDITTGICTVNEPNIGTCTGDIGSPLVYNKRVIGVVSRDVHCAKGMPDLYTSTYDNKEFIRNAMKE
ncbi:Chymotrypsin-1 [Dufourea novaeangliae]|uniref:Chymotrypsin-1 n=1 Tax=Dufourea novaeangliae TaxID=178035 RepID=A0A154NVV2_DUFNO|nr:Chymotrypsin-1 [Dufourea novaeangliae]